MSDTIQPNLQWPTPCDFGPFAGGYCGKVITIDFNQAQSQIDVADITIELLETATMTLDLSTLVKSLMPVDWTKTIFSNIPSGTQTFNATSMTLTYKPDETPSVDRVISFNYTVYDTLGAYDTGLITINVLDRTPVLTAGTVTLSGTEGQTYTIDLRNFVTATNTTVNYSDASKVFISATPGEGTATISNGIITYTPSQTPAVTRTVTFKYKVIDVTGISAEGSIGITLTDITPAITATAITKSVMDNATVTGSILSNITIKNDTFKSLTFSTPSEGTIVASGSNYTFTPDGTISTAVRTVVVTYTVTTTSGLTASNTITITVSDYNKYANTFWYGNSTVDIITQAAIEKDLTAVTKTAYAGTYALTAGSGVYKWFVYPKAWGITPTILDATTLMEIATDNYVFVTINGIDLIAIRTYYQVNGAINVKFS